MVVPIQWKYKSAIVECDWLKENIDNPLVRVYDCSTYLHYTDDHPSKPYDVVSGLTENSRFTKPLFYAACSGVFIDV